MNQFEWFLGQLQTSAEGFEQAFWSVPAQLRREMPIDEKVMGHWPAARHVWHVTEYERCVALPGIHLWSVDKSLDTSRWMDDDATWLMNSNISDKALIERFWETRRQQLNCMTVLRGVDFDECRDTGWGRKSLAWVLTKTIQHTWEHGDTLMRMGLWWDHIQEQIDLARAQKAGV